MLASSSLHGAFGLQKGPRIAEEVGVSLFSEAVWFAISVMRLDRRYQ